MNYKLDEEYVKHIAFCSNLNDELKDYTMCYVTIAPKQKLVASQLNSIFSKAVQNTKEKDLQIKYAKHNGDVYMFAFVKDDKDNKRNVNDISFYNSLLFNYIADGGINSARQKSGKRVSEDIDTAENTYFIDSNNHIRNLLEFPIALIELKRGDVNKSTFINTFKSAKINCEKWGVLKRKNIIDERGKEKTYIYIDISPDFYKKWIQADKNGSYKENINMLLNIIRLDLDQLSNACSQYYLLKPNGEIGEMLSVNNRAYINKNNSQSVCLIGSPKFNRDLLQYHYNKITKGFGNVYSIKDLMFLPDKKTLDEIVEYLQDRNTYIQENPITVTVDEINEYTKAHPTNNLSNKEQKSINAKKVFMDKIHAQNQTIVSHIVALDPHFEFELKNLDLEKENIQELLKYYHNLKVLRNQMNYKDQKEGRTVSMKNAYDLGYQNKLKKDILNRYGDIGGKIYDRAFCICFANYLLNAYKNSGAIYDLTVLTQLYDGLQDEDKVNVPILQDYNDEINKVLFDACKNGSINNYLSLVKKFGGVLDIQIYFEKDIFEEQRNINNSNEKEHIVVREPLKGTAYTDSVRKKIDLEIGDIITPWVFVENAKDINERLFASSNHISKEDLTINLFTNDLRIMLDKCEEKIINNRINNNNDNKEVID